MKHVFALAAPAVFPLLAACDFVGLLTVEVRCPLPIPVVTDSTLVGTFNGLCPYYVLESDTLRLVQPGVGTS